MSRPVTGRVLLPNLAAAVLVLAITGCATPEAPREVFAAPVYPPPPEQARFHYERTILSSADVVPDEGDAAFRRLVTGEKRSGVRMGKPYDIAVHHGRIFVSDTERRSVMVFDTVAGEFTEIGTRRPGELRKPLGIDVDANGNLYVCDATLGLVVMYDRDGNFVREIGAGEPFDRPAAVTVNANGTRIYVVDTGGVDSTRHRIAVFDGVTGEHVTDIGERGNADGYFNLPREAAVGANGDLLVVDSGNFRVQRFSPDGEFVAAIGSIGRQSGQFSRPKGIAVDASGHIYVSDTAFGNFQIFDEHGRLLLYIGERSATGKPGTFMLPGGIDVDDDGRIYVVDQFSKKIDIFRPEGAPPAASLVTATE